MARPDTRRFFAYLALLAVALAVVLGLVLTSRQAPAVVPISHGIGARHANFQTCPPEEATIIVHYILEDLETGARFENQWMARPVVSRPAGPASATPPRLSKSRALPSSGSPEFFLYALETTRRRGLSGPGWLRTLDRWFSVQPRQMLILLPMDGEVSGIENGFKYTVRWIKPFSSAQVSATVPPSEPNASPAPLPGTTNVPASAN